MLKRKYNEIEADLISRLFRDCCLGEEEIKSLGPDFPQFVSRFAAASAHGDLRGSLCPRDCSVVLARLLMRMLGFNRHRGRFSPYPEFDRLGSDWLERSSTTRALTLLNDVIGLSAERSEIVLLRVVTETLLCFDGGWHSISVLIGHSQSIYFDLCRHAGDIIGDKLSTLERSAHGDMKCEADFRTLLAALAAGYDANPARDWLPSGKVIATRAASMVMCWKIGYDYDWGLVCAGYAELLAAGGRPAICTTLSYPPKPVKYRLAEELDGGSSLCGDSNDLNYYKLTDERKKELDRRMASWRKQTKVKIA